MRARLGVLIGAASVAAGVYVSLLASSQDPTPAAAPVPGEELRGVKASRSVSSPDADIRFYEAQLQQHPELFAGFAALGAAYLVKARETHDFAWLGKARKAATRSLELQSNLNALLTMAEICTFSHRFGEARAFIERAALIPRGGASVLTLRIDAHLGLGELDAANQLIEPMLRAAAPSFAAWAARGRWFAEQERFDDANQAFIAAAEAARKQGNADLVVWAQTNAAGMYLDSGRPQLARPHLDAAAALTGVSGPTAAVLAVHWAEWHVLEGRPETALRIYESLIAHQEDPELLRRAYLLARLLADEQKAQSLFTAAEQAAERARAAGEVLALEAQALLYADAGVALQRADQLAQQNLRYKRDRSARQTLLHVQERIAASGR
jgi:tetratricopeptide (TPR) repeat protein